MPDRRSAAAWTVARLDAEPVLLDRSSSGQSSRQVTAIGADGIELISALELLDLGNFHLDRVQVRICEECGTTHCSSGGWVTWRRLGSRVVWMPAWSAMEAGEWEQEEYRPPGFMADRGALILAKEAWNELRGLVQELPAPSDLAPLTAREASRLLQWTAPGRVLGSFPAEPKLCRDVMLTGSTGELAADADSFQREVALLHASSAPVRTVDVADDATAVSFLLDLPGTPMWTPFARRCDAGFVLLGDGLAIAIVDG